MRESVIGYLKSRVSEYDKSGEFYRNSKFNYINIDKIQDFILTLPDELIKQVLRITEQTSQNLHLRRRVAEDIGSRLKNINFAHRTSIYFLNIATLSRSIMMLSRS